MRLTEPSELRVLIAGYALSTIADAGVRMILAWATLERSGTAAMSGVFVGSAAACLFGPLIGRGLDHWPPRVVLGASSLARCAVLLAVCLASPQTVARYAAATSFFTTLFSLAYGPAVAKALPMFASDRLHEANALTSVAFLVASAVGPALGGAVLARSGLASACAVFAAVSLANIPFALMVSFRHAPVSGQSRPFRRLLAALSSMPVVIALFALGVLLNFCLAPINVALAPLMLSFGAGPQGYGFAMSLFVLGAVVGNAAVGSRCARRIDWDQSIFASLGAIAFGLIAVGLWHTQAQTAATMTLLGALVPFFQVPMSIQLQRTIPTEDAGQAFATLNAVTMGAAPLAAAGAGLLLQWLSPVKVFYCAGISCGLICLGWEVFRRQESLFARVQAGDVE